MLLCNNEIIKYFSLIIALMKARGVFLVLVLIVLAQALVQAGYAFEFNAEVSPDIRAIKTNESADFSLKLTHGSTDTESFTVYSPDINWNVLLSEYPYFPQGTKELKLSLTPLNVNPGVYRIPVYIKSNSKNDVLKRYLSVELTSAKPESYERLPAIRAKLDFPSKVDPRTSTKLVLNLENRNNRELPNLLVKVRSELINEDYQTSLGPNDKKQVEFTINLPEKTMPQKDLLKISILMIENEKTFRYDVETKQFSVIQYGEVVVKEDLNKGWFTRNKLVKFTNTGNTPNTANYKETLGFFQKLFTSLTPDTTNGEWSFELNVNEERTIRIYTSYVSLVLFFIFLLLVVVSYFLFRSPIVLVKRTQVLKSTEGGINKLKVLLYVKNRSSHMIRNVRVMDVIPRLADFIEKTYEGTLNPVTIKKLEKGTLLKWQVDVLEPGEERIIYYNVMNKLSVLEGLTLPVAVAKFNVAGKVERSTKSNVLDVSF